MGRILSVCGKLCDACVFFNGTCEGCYHVKGASITCSERAAGRMCPLYRCAVMEKRYHSCGECAEMPCEKFNRVRGPALTAEENPYGFRERASPTG